METCLVQISTSVRQFQFNAKRYRNLKLGACGLSKYVVDLMHFSQATIFLITVYYLFIFQNTPSYINSGIIPTNAHRSCNFNKTINMYVCNAAYFSSENFRRAIFVCCNQSYDTGYMQTFQIYTLNMVIC